MEAVLPGIAGIVVFGCLGVITTAAWGLIPIAQAIRRDVAEIADRLRRDDQRRAG